MITLMWILDSNHVTAAAVLPGGISYSSTTLDQRKINESRDAPHTRLWLLRSLALNEAFERGGQTI